jgi:hypothetical protein
MAIDDDTTSLQEQCSALRRNSKRLTRLEAVCWNESYASDYFILLGQSLIGNTHLRDIRFNNLRLTEAVARSLAAGISQSKLEILLFRESIYEENPPKQGKFRRILLEGIRCCRTVRNFRASNISDRDEVKELAAVLPFMYSLETLAIFEFYSSGDRYARLVSEVLIRQPSLQILVLCNGVLEGADVLLIATALHQNRSLLTLELFNCKIDDRAVGLLVTHWHPDSRISRLYLESSQFGPAGVQLLLQAAREHRALRKLRLSGNGQIGLEGLRLIGNFLPNLQHMTHLQIRHCARLNEFDDLSCEAALQQEQDRFQAGRPCSAEL